MEKSLREWVDFIWNPLSGCKANCTFCYGRKRTGFTGDRRWNVNHGTYTTMGDVKILDEPFLSPSGAKLNAPFGFAPTFYRFRLNTPDRWKMTRKILVCGYSEMFGPWIPTEIIEEIFDACKKYPKHYFLFLTKYPSRYAELEMQGKLPKESNFWYGTSLPAIEGETFVNKEYHTYAVMEPLVPNAGYDVPNVDWLVIGAENRCPVPNMAQITTLVFAAHILKRIPIYMTDNLHAFTGIALRKEYPEDMQHTEEGDARINKTYGTCIECGRYCKMDTMANFMIRTKRREHYKKIFCMCEECFLKFCEERNIEPPKMAGFKYSENKENNDEQD